MSGLALVARALGAEVTGSDRAESSYCARLRAAGIEPASGHDAANYPPGAELVVSSAIPADNPELRAARAVGARVLHRGELLGAVSRLRRSITISGTHGKTTTAAMAAHALLETGRDPSFLIGGELRAAGTNARWGAGEWIVIEGDESDRSFLELAREVAVVTNVELDHHATYRSLREVEQAFAEFVEPAAVRVLGPGVALPGRGEAVRYALDADGEAGSPGAAAGAPGHSAVEHGQSAVEHGQSAVEHGQSAVEHGAAAVELRASAVELRPSGSRFEVAGVAVELAVPGRHNVLNALAALAACRVAGVQLGDAAAALAGFSGAGRRFEVRGRSPEGALIVDDYAHHPTEVAATLEAARTLAPRRLLACFQPHLFSRTRLLARDFGRALALADVVLVLDVYPARERPEDHPGVSGLLVAQAAADAARGRPVWWLPRMVDAERLLRAELRAGDLLLTLGAGDVDQLAARLSAAPREAAA
jgi:UDP-N-acetylmuramate--alanine ligase